MEPADVLLANAALPQCGAFSYQQALDWGLSKYQLYRLAQSGRIVSAHPGTYYLPGRNDSFMTRLWLAVLWSGKDAAVSHRAAASLHRLDLESRIIEISTPHRKSGIPKEITFHSTETWHRGEVVEIVSLPVTSVTRTLLDLGTYVTRDQLELALEAGLRKRLTSIPTLRDALERRKARRGTALLRELLDLRVEGTAPTESPLETRFVQFARRYRLPKMERQFEVFEGDRLVARVDFAIPEARLAIEVNGYRWHSGRQAWNRDQARLSYLAELGWRVIFVTKESLEKPAQLAREIRRALGQPYLFI